MFESLWTVLVTALVNAQADWRNAHHNYTNPLLTDDRHDVRWAYEAMVRAEYRLRWLGVRNFDVA